MTKDQLKYLVNEIVRRKLAEADFSMNSISDKTVDALSDKEDSTKPEIDPKKQPQIDATQKNIDKITADMRKLDGNISKLQEPVRKKMQDLERKKANLQKKQGAETKKLEDLKTENTVKLSNLKQIIRESVIELIQESTLPTGVSPAAIKTLDQFLNDKLTEADGDFLGATTSPVSPEDMQDYLHRTKTGAKTKREKFTMPYIHRGNIEIKNAEDKAYDQERLKASIKTRPEKILKQNKKMEKSGSPNTVFFDIGLPALVGLAVNEKTNEFIVINTCPGAGACKVYCYAKKGGYVQWKDASMSQTRLLNYLVNDPQGFKAQFESELSSKLASLGKRKKTRGKKILIRWHDAGDFFSPEYLNLAYSIARDFPEVQFYAYTKIANVAKGEKPSNFLINFSMGASPEEEKQIDFGKEKHSTVVPKPMFDKYVLKDEKGKAIKDEKNRVQFKDVDALNAFKKDLAMKYSVPVESVLTYDEMMETPESSEEKKYNVIVRPGDGDVSASRRDVKGTYLLIH